MKMVAGSTIASDTTNQSSRFLISDLCSLLESYLESDQVRKIYNAYLFSANAHEGQNASDW